MTNSSIAMKVRTRMLIKMRRHDLQIPPVATELLQWKWMGQVLRREMGGMMRGMTPIGVPILKCLKLRDKVTKEVQGCDHPRADLRSSRTANVYSTIPPNLYTF